MKENLIAEKSFAFSVRMIRAYQHLTKKKHEYILSKQVLRSATSIGANVHEATNAQSKKDFLAKNYVAFKEATETEYWLKLLTTTEYLTEAEGASLLSDCVELKKILNAIITTTKEQIV